MSGDKDVLAAIATLVNRISDLNLRVETMRVLLRSKGVTDADFDRVYEELRENWNQMVDSSADESAAKLRDELLRRLLDSHEGTKQ